MELSHPTVDEIDLSDFDFWTQPPEVIEGAFATLRAERPIAFFEEPVVELLRSGEFEAYVPAWFRDITPAKFPDTTGYLDGSVAYTRERLAALGLQVGP